MGQTRNRTPDRYQAQYPDRIPMYLPKIILPYPHFRHSLARPHVGMRDGPTRASGKMGGAARREMVDGKDRGGAHKLIEGVIR